MPLQAGTFGRAVAFDMPGFGKADKPNDFDYTVRGYARHLDSALSKLRVRRAHLVLHDFGGAWGLAWAAANADRPASVTLINIGLMPGYRWHYLTRIWRMPVVGEIFRATATRAAFHLRLKHGNPRGLPAAFVNRMNDDYDSGTRRAVLQLYRATSEPGALADLTGTAFRQLDVRRSSSGAPRIPMPPWRTPSASASSFAAPPSSSSSEAAIGRLPTIPKPLTPRSCRSCGNT